MTKQQAIETVEATGAKALSCRMSAGTPKVTVSWKDYVKVRNIAEVENEEFEICVR